MSKPRSTTVSNGRDPGGRFGVGNHFATGNPYARRVARLRAAMFRAVSPEDLGAVVTKLVEQAKGGDVASMKELLARLLGPPTDLDFLERLEVLEERIAALQPRE